MGVLSIISVDAGENGFAKAIPGTDPAVMLSKGFPPTAPKLKAGKRLRNPPVTVLVLFGL